MADGTSGSDGAAAAPPADAATVLRDYLDPERYTVFLRDAAEADGDDAPGTDDTPRAGGTDDAAPATTDPVGEGTEDPARPPAAGDPVGEDRPSLLRAPSWLDRPVRDGTGPDGRSRARYLARSCDLTLTGGLDTALAAPVAACALAGHYVVRRVGGGSVGAAAAAAVAAAELGRTATPGTVPPGSVAPGYPGLAGTVCWLAGDGPGGAAGGPADERWRLAGLLRPADDAAHLHRILAAALRPRPGQRPRRALRTAAALLAVLDRRAGRVAGLLWTGAVTGATGTVVALGRSPEVSGRVLPLAAVPLTLTFGLAAAFGTALLTAQSLRRAVRTAATADGWGLVSGSAHGSAPLPVPPRRLDRIAGAAPGEEVPPLFDWLADRLDDLAGVPAPSGAAQRYAVTFGDLWLGRIGRRTAAEVRLLRRAADRPAARVVDLRLVATDLAGGRPHLLPFDIAERPAQRRAAGFLFCRACLVGVLPTRVADQMVLLSPGTPAGSPPCPRHADEPLHELPEPWDLPVVLAVRLAAAVPGVLRAVPLHRDGADGVRTHWFCDAAVSGGLPPGLFDVPLPRWPTFTLGTVPGGDGTPLVPALDDAGPAAPWRAVRGGTGIAAAALGAAWDWRGVLRARSASRRGGTALVRGGETGPYRSRTAVLGLALAGHRAGVMLRERFAGPDAEEADQTGTDRFRWARMRTALAQWRQASLAVGARVPLYTDLALDYRVPAGATGWFSPPLVPGTADPAWGDAVAAVTHLRSLADGGVLDWDADWGAPPSDADDRLA